MRDIFSNSSPSRFTPPLDDGRGLPSNSTNISRANSLPKPKDVFESCNHQLDMENTSQNYLGPNRLIKGAAGTSVLSKHQEWFLHQAIFLGQAQNPDLNPKIKNQLDLAILNAYSKAASINKQQAKEYDIQTTPLPSARYHRSAENKLLKAVHQAYIEDMGMEKSNNEELLLIHSFLFQETLERNFPQPGLNLKLENEKEFHSLIEQLINSALDSHMPPNKALIDISTFFSLSGKNQPNEINVIAREFEKIFWQIAEEKANAICDKSLDSNHSVKMISDRLERLRERLQLVAFITHKDQPILLLPQFLTTSYQMPIKKHLENSSAAGQSLIQFPEMNKKQQLFFNEIESFIQGSGYIISIDQAKQAWLNVKDLASILTDLNLPVAEFDTQGSKIPEVFKSYKELLNNSAMLEFMNLKNEKFPYLKILSEGAVNLLTGLDKCHGSQGIDQAFKEKGLGDLLQISYFRLINALKDATLRKYDSEFYNQIEIIHQFIQDVVGITEPYDNRALENSVIEKLAQEPLPIINKNLNPKVHLMPSAMHSVSSLIASIEKQKGSNHLNGVVLKDSYYESCAILEHAKTHNIAILDGDFFKEGLDEDYFTESKMKEAFNRSPNQPSPPIDFFICEFHHNISTTRVSYYAENIIQQIKAMSANGMMADQFTVVIDTTMDLERSELMRLLLADEDIQNAIQEGFLNIAFVRSAQKFDMLGMDNYSGGISISVNNDKFFSAFNQRMSVLEDQLKGLSYQGLTHLQKYGGSSADDYRKAIMQNTQILYKQLPQAAIFNEKLEEHEQNPMQISQIHDPRATFLDIKFNEYKKTGKAFEKSLKLFARNENLPLSTRASFGFPNSNFVIIEGVKYRFTPGLEDEKTINRYAFFFHAIQQVIEATLKDKAIKASKLDEEIAKRIDSLNFNEIKAVQ